jgi:dinuclear metal center YbgI/SA1388 family protein
VARRDDIVAFADKLLDLGAFADYGPVGLQVVGSEEVTSIACGVSASRELFERAAGHGAQLVIVHHGLFWNRDPRVVDRVLKGRLKALFDADLSLAAYHLALDAHRELGNNTLLAAQLGVAVEARFGDVGWGGRLHEPATLADLTSRIESTLGRAPLAFPYGPDRIERVAICSGGAAALVTEAAASGYDCYVTGEAAEPTNRLACETGIHFVAAGHHATEISGVQALSARLAEEFGLDWTYVDVPNPV